MAMSGQSRRRTRVRIPPDVQRPFDVYVNGVPQVEGVDYLVRAGALEFGEELQSEGKVGAARWTSMLLGISGTYRKNDSVDIVYTVNGRRQVAAKLPFEDAV